MLAKPATGARSVPIASSLRRFRGVTEKNKHWVSIDVGNFQQGRKATLFVGGDTPVDLRDALINWLGEPMTDALVGHFTEAIADPFDIATGTLAAGGITATPDPAAPMCDHGARIKRTGTNARGAWTGWFCPLPRDSPGQCKPQYS